MRLSAKLRLWFAKVDFKVLKLCNRVGFFREKRTMRPPIGIFKTPKLRFRVVVVQLHQRCAINFRIKLCT